MPVMVIGADTPTGRRLVEALAGNHPEVRAFVTDPGVAGDLKGRGIKVATGDVSDHGHVAAACTNVFTAVLVTEAATDERDRSFAAGPDDVLAGWVEAVEDAGVTRVIWVSAETPPRTRVAQEAVVDPGLSDAVSEVVRLDEAAEIPGRG